MSEQRRYKVLSREEMKRLAPSAMFFMGDGAWGACVEEMSAEQVAQKLFWIRGQLEGDSRGLEVAFPSFRDACRVARGLSVQELMRVIFRPDRSFVLDCSGTPSKSPEEEAAEDILEEGAADA